MFGIYNMGIGMIIITAKEHENEVLKALEAAGEKAYIIGEMALYEGKEIEIC